MDFMDALLKVVGAWLVQSHTHLYMHIMRNYRIYRMMMMYIITKYAHLISDLCQFMYDTEDISSSGCGTKARISTASLCLAVLFYPALERNWRSSNFRWILRFSENEGRTATSNSELAFADLLCQDAANKSRINVVNEACGWRL